MSLVRAEKADVTEGGAVEPPQADSQSNPRSKAGSQASPNSRRTRERAPDSMGAAPAPAGGVLFASAARYTEASLDFAERRFLVVSLPPGASYRHLLRAIDDAVEGALALRGALPRETKASADVEATVRDQVIRAHALGLSGIAVMFPRLSREQEGSLLSVEESMFVSAWIGAAQRGLAAVLFDEHDREIGVLAPRRLADVASSPKTGHRPERISASVLPPAPSVRDSIPPSGKIIKTPEPGPVTLKASSYERPAHAVDQPLAAPPKEEKDPPTLRFRGESAPPPSAATPPPRSVQTEPPPSTVTSRHSALNKRLLLSALGAKRARLDAEPAASDAGPPSVSKQESASPPAPTQSAPPPEPISIRSVPSSRCLLQGTDWRAHAAELDKARGPKPVGVIERLFITRYMPLLGAMSRGEADGAARAVIDGFRTDFEQSHRDIASAPRVNGKRPALVSDAADIAAWVGRLSGAQAVRLLLIDAMRFDIGERVVSRIHGRAMCVERILLWSAPAAATAAMPGEVITFDLVKPRLSAGGAGYEERIESIASEVAESTLRYMETLPPRTLVFMFGNHGFQLPCGQDGRSTGAATQGGVSPEEVLVPGHAWLTGGAR